MKFSQNGLYIEKYVKCANCGTLIYANDSAQMAQTVEQDGQTMCSQWCVDWAEARTQRRRETAGQ
ncbi:hypothetical protein [Paraburkholderia hospita]|uniref:hypothetical protein n=1 Tax=Paraburkholderia hospita TaxID=169430 RepID=UPI000B3429AB|nr:hypothetical protein [Paraburkholderia hospita]OUL97611.1 hypothetical protein CA603_01605 [Paraburkholderia hospita]